MDGYITGRFLGELRKQKGLKQREVAEAIQVSDKAVSRWETGRGIPDVDSLQRLSVFYEVSISEILAGRYLREDEIKEVSEGNLQQMGKKASILKKKLLAAIMAMTGLFILLLVILLYKSPTMPVGIIMQRKFEYSISNMDAFFQDIAALEDSGIEYDITVFPEYELILVGVEAYQYQGELEDLEFKPEDLKTLPVLKGEL